MPDLEIETEFDGQWWLAVISQDDKEIGRLDGYAEQDHAIAAAKRYIKIIAEELVRESLGL